MHGRDIRSCLRQVVLIATVALTTLFVVPARASTLDDLVSSVVHIKTFINPDGTSVSNLGKEREGSGIVIDESGLVLTIGYLMVEAHAAEIVTNSGRALPATSSATTTRPGSDCCERSSRRRSSRCLWQSADSRNRTRRWWRASAAPAGAAGPRR